MEKQLSRIPLISIITVTYNCHTILEKTILSLLNQSYTNYEYIIIDGDSHDETKNVIKKYKDKLSYYISEPDKGIYDAMNKGIKFSKGKYIYFLNAGDYLYKNILFKIANELEKSKVDFLYGNIIFGNLNIKYDGRFSKMKISYKNICQQSIFYQRNIFNKLGEFDLSYHVLADWRLNIKVFADAEIKKKYLNEIIAYYEIGGFSSQNKDYKFEKNQMRIVKNELGIYCLFILMGMKIKRYLLNYIK